MIPDVMPAVLAREEGPRGSWNPLVLEMVPRPGLRSGEVLVKVEACSVNRADLLQRRGLYPPPPGASRVLGLDFAGSIVGVSPEMEHWCVGDRVFGIVPGGGYARYLTIAGDQLLGIPSNLGFSEDFEERLMRFSRGGGVDVVLDWVGGPYLEKHLRLLKTRGRLVLMGLMGGSRGEIPLDLILGKRLRVMGSVLRSRSNPEKAGIIGGFEAQVLPWPREGLVKPVVHRVLPMARVEEAHRILKEGSHFGKVVLVWDAELS
ncbi:MAG: zinc-binding dehydrogenase [Syntrophobacteraceae bacterium]|jgi:NADPH:quinone reductase-like Zn-dependent oxidoreductase|nr:zinc-binding dehydrogenase [Syntrophobacteraceae bacterium]